MMPMWANAAAIALTSVSLAQDQPALRLVERGTTQYRVVVDEGAVDGPKLAAAELAAYLEKATGARFAVLEVDAEADLSRAQRVIVVGESAYTRSLGISLETARPESYVISTVGQNLIIAGRDSPGDPLAPEFTAKSGTLVGVYAFLREYAGIRWFLPGELWESVRRANDLVVPAVNRLEEPDFVRRDPHRYRAMPEKERQDHALWARRNGAGMGVVGYAKHSWYEHFRDVSFDEHPDWFAEVDGERRPMQAQQPQGQICTSNPEVVRHIVGSVRKWLDEHPEYDVCSISANDGRGFCECDGCRALDVPDTGTITDRMFTFYGAVATEVAGTHPDKYIGAYAYSSYNELPVRIESLPANILLTHVQNSTRMRGPEGEAAGMERIVEWGSFHPRISFYTFPVGSGYWGLPAPNTRWVRKLMPHLKPNRFQGIKLAALCYAGLQPDLYLYMQLLWDADQDVDALLDEYYERLFGSVGPQVRRYHDTIEASWEKNVVTPGFADPWRARDRHRALLDVYEPVIPECRALLDEAIQKAPNDTVRQRVQIFSDNFHLAELLVEGTRVSGYYGERPQRPPPDRIKRMIEIANEFNAFVQANLGSHAIELGSIERASKGVNIMDVARWEEMLPTADAAEGK